MFSTLNIIVFNLFHIDLFLIVKRTVSFSLSDETLDEIDDKRGLIPRSRIIEGLLIKGLKSKEFPISDEAVEIEKEGSAGVPNATNTKTPAPLSSTRDEVDNGISS